MGSRWTTLTTIGYFLRTRCGPRWRSRAALEAWQDRQVRRHLRWVLARSPFYRAHFAGHPPERWQELPTIDKGLMMAHFDELNTVGAQREEAFALARQAEASRDFTPTLGGVTVGLSSGTSGNQGLFLVSPHEQAAWAGVVLGKLLPHSLLAPHRIAFFLRASSNLYQQVGQGRLQFRFFDLLEPLALHLERLEQFQPTVLVAPPSMLRLLAEAPAQIRPGKVISVAEVLEEVDRQVIGRAFGQPVHQVYQCTEGFLGATCEHGTLHLNEDLAVIQKEYLDRDLGKFVPVITDFSRTSQPIIRYRLNDILTERRAPCPCGSVFTAIERIEGRCDDLFYLPGLDGVLQPLFPDFVSRAVAGASPAVLEYRVVQQGADQVDVHLRLADGANRPEVEAAITGALTALCRRMSLQPPAIRHLSYAFTPGGRKLRRVERRFAP